MKDTNFYKSPTMRSSTSDVYEMAKVEPEESELVSLPKLTHAASGTTGNHVARNSEGPAPPKFASEINTLWYLVRQLISVLFIVEVFAIAVVLIMASVRWKYPDPWVTALSTGYGVRSYSELRLVGNGVKTVFIIWGAYSFVFGLSGQFVYRRKPIDTWQGLCAIVFVDAGMVFTLFITFVAGPFNTYGAQRCINDLTPHLWILAIIISPLPAVHALFESCMWYLGSRPSSRRSQGNLHDPEGWGGHEVGK